MRTAQNYLLAASSMAVIAAGALVGPPAAAAVSFRVENKVFINAEKEPRSQSTTLFYEGRVFDFLEKPAETTVFDPGHHLFVLLDPAHRVKTEFSSDEVAALCDNLQVWAKKQTDPLLQFMAEPRFEQGLGEAAGELVFKSEWMTYRVTTAEGVDEAIGRQYREFSDWYTKLNARVNPGSRLPFARLEVNRVLDRDHAFPREVRLTVQPKKGLAVAKYSARSEHTLVTRLSQADLDRIRQTEQFMTIFQPVAFDQYQKKMGR